ncbi:MAG: phenylalanine--tRNA ligase subunit beta [Puniceicoccales bacterium]|nr:phenylalanine--tRNA ligase subunit beta [Puniceicoccales bacterium]
MAAMKVSLRWLRRWLPKLDAGVDEICDALVSLGIGVESRDSTGIPQQFLVVGEIISFEKHPRADRLRVCRVDVDADRPKQIVCGATNFQAGDRVPVAIPGCVMPEGIKIQATDFRGVRSEGMMCSGRELGLSDDHGGLLILEKNTPIGAPLHVLFPDCGDTVLDLEITANRGDCMSHFGVARELAAFFNVPFAAEYEERPATGTTANSLLRQLSLESDDCHQFIAWAIRGVKVGQSPDWLRRDLERIGLRSVNNVVDITNWILMDSGQPLHAFDARKIHGQRLHIRRALPGEQITTLNHKTYTLDGNTLVIADDARALVIAGIMGSVDAEVDGQSADIVIESATFEPRSIQRTARKLGIHSDASQRFARGTDPLGAFPAAQRAVRMITEICDGVADSAPVLVRDPKRSFESPRISLTGNFVREKFGMAIPDDVIENALQRLHFDIRREDDRWSVTVPSFRAADVTEPIDLVEEFIRFHGVEKLGRQPVRMEAVARDDDGSFSLQRSAADLLVSLGFCECYNYSTRRGEELKKWGTAEQTRGLALKNPLNQDQSHLRFSLIPGLLESLDHNLRNGNAPTKLFETGRVWDMAQDGDSRAYEALAISWVQLGEPAQTGWDAYQAPNFYSMKAIGEKIAALAGIASKNSRFFPAETPMWQRGHCGRFGSLPKFPYALHCGLLDMHRAADLGISKSIWAGEWLILPEFLNRAAQPVSFRNFGTFPSVMRDLAVIADGSMPAETARLSVEKCIQKSLPVAVRLADLWIFDIYKGNGVAEAKKSIGLRFGLECTDRTIGEEEIQSIFSEIVTRVAKTNGLAVRTS